MLSFATEFPVEADRTTVDFLQAMVTWISGSPHTGLSAEMLRDLLQKDEAHVENGKEKVQSLLATSPDVDLAGIRYSRHDNDLEWLTTVVFSRTSSDAWVGVRVECESQHAAARLPSAKKPVVVRTVLESLGGAADGPLPIRDTAHILTNTDIDLAAKLIRGDAGCRLPIVYVSARFQGGYILDVNRLAADLSGMAHVVVEPNRPFPCACNSKSIPRTSMAARSASAGPRVAGVEPSSWAAITRHRVIWRAPSKMKSGLRY